MKRYLSIVIVALFLVAAGASQAADKEERTAKADEAKSAAIKADEAKADEAKSDEAKADEAKADEAKADEAASQDDFTQSKKWNKLGDSLKQAYLTAKTAGFPEQRLRCFVRTRDPINPGDRSFLNSKGFNVQIVSGRSARGTLEPKNLPYIAELYFVQKISMAKKQ